YVPEDFEDQMSPLLQYTVTGPYMLEAIREWLVDEVEPELGQVEGVGTVFTYGGRDRVLFIELDEARIQSLGLRPERVRAAVSELEVVSEAGAVVTDDGQLRMLAIRERAASIDEIRQLPVLMDQGRIVRVANVGRVFDTFEEPRSYYRIDGFPAVSMYIFKAPRVNSVETADRARAAVDQLALRAPAGVRFILDADQSEDIRAQLSDLRTRAFIAAGIVLIVLLLFLRSIRAAVVIFSTLVFAILITINLIYFGGLTLNVLTLMGLAMGFGLVVDNAIVVLENIDRLRRKGVPALEAARRGAREVVLPILAATGTTIVVVIPFVYLQGELRIYYVPLAIVVGISLAASLFVAFTFIPALGARLFRDRSEFRVDSPLPSSPPLRRPPSPLAPSVPSSESREPGTRNPEPGTQLWIVRLYAGLIRLSLRHAWLTVVLVLGMLAGSYHLFDTYVSRGMIWRWGRGDRTYIDIFIRQPRGEELEHTDQVARFFEERLRRMPEIERFTTNVRDAANAHIKVDFPEALEWTAVPLAIQEQLVQYSLLFGGTDVRVYGRGPSFYGGGGGSAPNYSITVLGYNYEKVHEIAEDLGQRLERISRVREVDTNSSGRWYSRDQATELVLDVDRSRLALHSLSAADIVGFVGSTVRGRTFAQTVRIGGEEMQISVKLEGHDDMDLLRLGETLIPAANGENVRVGDIATLDERRVLAQVVRENQQYRRFVSYEFRGPTKLGDVYRDAVIGATDLPPGYTIEGKQEFEFGLEDEMQIYGVLIVSVFLIFMVTAAVFESIKQPFYVLLTVPMALIGVFLIFFYTNANFTREAYIGVIMMAGIVVNNAILLVDHVNQLRRVDGLRMTEALVRGTTERVRPILMTSLTTICGLLPLVLFAETANANIWNALGFALIGGLSSSTFLVLTVTPALYLIFESRAERKRLAADGIVDPLLEKQRPWRAGFRLTVRGGRAIGGVVRHPRRTASAVRSSIAAVGDGRIVTRLRRIRPPFMRRR
ncbi:MAG: efflux RND transporter permease subunit, partial [Longimicrobiales bacterium]